MVPLAADHELCCFLDERSDERFALRAPNVRREVVAQGVAPTVAASSGSGRSPIDMLRLTNAVRRSGVDVFFSPSVYGYFPLPFGLPAVVTVHDAIAERFPALTLPTLRDRLFWWSKVRFALLQAQIVMTVSDFAAADIERHLRVPRSRIRVTLEGVASEYRPSTSHEEIAAAAARAGLPPNAKWVIYVGGFGAHKHVDALVRAHGRVARRQDFPLFLLLVGSRTDGFLQDIGSIEQAISDVGSHDLVRWLGFLPDAELRHLHSGAIALALVSAAEGFGLPAVEAARCGTPVVATTESPLPKILEGGGVFVSPGDSAAIERALEHLLADEDWRRALGARAQSQAELLSWPKSAAVVLDALESVSRSRRVA
jgi:glycosyltransferase involved in cell wall biosynthesis